MDRAITGNKKYFLVLGIIIMVLIVDLLVWSILQPTTDFYSCVQDSDCTKVQGDCCGCTMGGTAATINKGTENAWQEKLDAECQGVACTAVISNHPSCFKEPRCMQNKCVLE